MSRRLRLALGALALVLVGGTVGYVLLGFGWLDAAYQTVTTVTTVGFREVQPLTAGGKVFTILLILVGVGTALYTLGLLLEAVIEGHLRERFGRRRMEHEIAQMDRHVVICGWGRVGSALAAYLTAEGEQVVVVDRDPARLQGLRHATVLGDVSDDAVLKAAGVLRARVLVATLATDADNVYVTLSARALRPDLLIIARARSEASEALLQRAGADRVVNAQRIGAQRMGAFALQPHVADFLDVVMHDQSLEFRIEEVTLSAGSPLAGRLLGDLHIADSTGALLLAIRQGGGPFRPTPPLDTELHPGCVLIAVGTPGQLAALRALAGIPLSAPSR